MDSKKHTIICKLGLPDNIDGNWCKYETDELVLSILFNKEGSVINYYCKGKNYNLFDLFKFRIHRDLNI